jgi:SNF2 family DNA or RNA helicase
MTPHPSRERSSSNGSTRAHASASSKLPAKQWPLYSKLDSYQKEAVEFASPLAGCGLFFEQGTGKTWIAAAIIERMIDTNFSGLIVVPLTSRDSTWVDLIRRELPHIAIAHAWDEFIAMPCPRLLILHKEGLRGGAIRHGSRRRKALDQRIRRHRWGIVIIDESQGIKDRASAFSRAARFLRDQPKRLALSGTPVEQSPLDVWAQMRFIEPWALGDRWSDFTDEYCRPAGWMGKKWEFRRTKLDQFLRAIQPYCLRVTKEVLNLQPYELVPEHIDLWGVQRRLYEDLERHMVAEVEGRMVISQLKVVNLIRLQQVTGGFATDVDGQVFPVGNAKVRRVRRVIGRGDVTPPFVVFCRYRPEIDAVTAELKRHYARVETLTGSTGGRHKSLVRAELNRRFQAGEIDALVCQTRTGGVSVDLFAARQAIVFSTTFSFIDFDQMVSRLHRRGQKHRVKIILLLAKNTIDIDIIGAIQQKTSVVKIVLDRLKKGIRHGTKESSTRAGARERHRVSLRGRPVGGTDGAGARLGAGETS